MRKYAFLEGYLQKQAAILGPTAKTSLIAGGLAGAGIGGTAAAFTAPSKMTTKEKLKYILESSLLTGSIGLGGAGLGLLLADSLPVRRKITTSSGMYLPLSKTEIVK